MTVTWNNAPGNPAGTQSIGADANTTLIIANRSVSGTSGVWQSSLVNNTTGSTTALIDFLNADTNGLVTFLFYRPTSPGSTSGNNPDTSNRLTFKEFDPSSFPSESTAANWHAPMLYLEYEPAQNSEIPEPATLGLLAIASVVLLPIAYARRRRKLA